MADLRVLVGAVLPEYLKVTESAIEGILMKELLSSAREVS
jgi:hypothetical protein